MKQVTIAEGKDQSEMKITYRRRQIARMICGFFQKSLATMKPSWASEVWSEVQLKNDNVQAFDSKWDEVLSAVTDRLADKILKRMHNIRKVGGIEICVSSLRPRDNIGRQKKDDYCRLELIGPRTSRAENQGSQLKARNRDEDRLAIGASSKG